MAVFLIGGLWHGAGWTFIFWGFLHGFGLVVTRLWRNFNIIMPKVLAVFLTFNFVNITWVFFRAKSWSDAIKVIKGMCGFNGLAFSEDFMPLSAIFNKLVVLEGVGLGIDVYRKIIGELVRGNAKIFWLLGLFLIVVFFFKNSNEMVDQFKPSYRTVFFTIFISIFSMLSLGHVSEFIYFNF